MCRAYKPGEPHDLESSFHTQSTLYEHEGEAPGIGECPTVPARHDVNASVTLLGERSDAAH